MPPTALPPIPTIGYERNRLHTDMPYCSLRFYISPPALTPEFRMCIGLSRQLWSSLVNQFGSHFQRTVERQFFLVSWNSISPCEATPLTRSMHRSGIATGAQKKHRTQFRKEQWAPSEVRQGAPSKLVRSIRQPCDNRQPSRRY